MGKRPRRGGARGAAPAGNGSGDVLGELVVRAQERDDLVGDLLGGHVGRREERAEVVVQDLLEERAVGLGDAHRDGHGRQGLAVAAGHVLAELIHHRADQRLAAVGDLAVRGAAVGAGGHAERGIASGAVGDAGDHVGAEAGLAVHDHVAPAAVRAARRFGEGGGRQAEQGRQDEYAFHVASQRINR
jgi:hypothetical protein